MRAIAFVVGEAPAGPCKPADFCRGRFGEAFCRYADITERQYLDTFGRLNLYSYPEAVKNDLYEDVDAAARLLKAAITDAVHIGADRVYILCMGSRVSSALSIAMCFQDASGGWLDTLREGSVRTSMANINRVEFKTGDVQAITLYFPHPSGLSRAWNDRRVVDTFRQLIHKLMEGVTPYLPSKIIASCGPGPACADCEAG
jgi:hypothetical protein